MIMDSYFSAHVAQLHERWQVFVTPVMFAIFMVQVQCFGDARVGAKVPKIVRSLYYLCECLLPVTVMLVAVGALVVATETGFPLAESTAVPGQIDALPCYWTWAKCEN